MLKALGAVVGTHKREMGRELQRVDASLVKSQREGKTAELVV